jgi:hypothetical protein
VAPFWERMLAPFRRFVGPVAYQREMDGRMRPSLREHGRDHGFSAEVTETLSGSSRVRVMGIAAFSDDVESAVASTVAVRPFSSVFHLRIKKGSAHPVPPLRGGVAKLSTATTGFRCHCSPW